MTYQPRRQAWAHQAEALEKSEGKKAFAFLMAMRTGKTKVLLDDFGRLAHKAELADLLVIAPAGVYETWKPAAEEDLAVPFRLHTWRSGGGLKDRKDRESFLKDFDKTRVLLVNVEALSTVQEARALTLKYLGQRRAMTAIDESTTVKNPTAKRTKFIVSQVAPLSLYRRILSGLPTPQSPLDAFSQFEFLDRRILGFKNFYAFRERFAIMRKIRVGGREVKIVVGYRDTDALAKMIEPYSFRRRLEDVYDLPPKMYSTRKVEMTKEQRRVYEDLKKYATVKLESEDHVTATLVITQMLKLHQVLCGHVADENGVIHPVPEKRTDELLELLGEYDGKAIVWVSYDWDVTKVHQALEKEYGEGSAARFWGGNRMTREEEERRFREDPRCRFMVATPAAGGRGRMWAVADLVVYYSSTADLEHRSQSEERPQAVGKEKSVAYVDFVCEGTVEEKILKSLRSKIDLASQITGDDWREWVV
jgi:SNF2 family DNA or RNA helicase